MLKYLFLISLYEGINLIIWWKTPSKKASVRLYQLIYGYRTVSRYGREYRYPPQINDIQKVASNIYRVSDAEVAKLEGILKKVGARYGKGSGSVF